MKPAQIRYQAYYCEENAWWLCADPAFKRADRRVVFISNPDRSCYLAQQRAGGARGVVFWDYHVICLVEDQGWQVWDPDTLLGMPVSAPVYLARTFAQLDQLPARHHPSFRVIEGEDFIDGFCTDRSHMRDGVGGWRQTPPRWDAPNGRDGVMNLMRYVDVTQSFDGEILTLGQMKRRFG